MKRVAVSALLFPAILSCSDGSERVLTNQWKARAAFEVSTIEAEEDSKEASEDDAPEADPSLFRSAVPLETYADVASLCTDQMKRIADRLAEIERERREWMSVDEKLEPSCREDKNALNSVRIRLDAPFQDITAITYDAGYSTQTSLVVRSAAGWQAVATPFMVADHDDPGCPSILRDGGLVAIDVDRGRLVVTDRADRGWGDGGLVFQRVRTCEAQGDAIGCGEGATIAATFIESQSDAPKEREVFRTTFTINEHGAVVTARSWDDRTFDAIHP